MWDTLQIYIWVHDKTELLSTFLTSMGKENNHNMWSRAWETNLLNLGSRMLLRCDSQALIRGRCPMTFNTSLPLDSSLATPCPDSYSRSVVTLAQCRVISFEVCKVLSVSSIITVILLLKQLLWEEQMIFLYNMPLVLVKAVNGRQHPFQKQMAGHCRWRTPFSQGGEKSLAGNWPMVCSGTLACQIDLLANGMGTRAKRPPIPRPLTWSRGGPPRWVAVCHHSWPHCRRPPPVRPRSCAWRRRRRAPQAPGCCRPVTPHRGPGLPRSRSRGMSSKASGETAAAGGGGAGCGVVSLGRTGPPGRSVCPRGRTLSRCPVARGTFGHPRQPHTVAGALETRSPEERCPQTVKASPWDPPQPQLVAGPTARHTVGTSS